MLKVILLVLSIVCMPWRNLIAAFKITGATGGINSSSGALPMRLEINDFAESGPAFDLYVLALQSLQNMDQRDPLSYFQVAGIHGWPAAPWDGVTGNGNLPGYCMHGSITFPFWHRPYLALFEQLVWMHAQTIANTYPSEELAQYQAAALTLRIPYWEWVLHPQLPAVFTNPVIYVNSPTGYHQIDNPLYRYDFHSGPEGNTFPPNFNLSYVPYTLRWPNAQLNESHDSTASNVMQNKAAQTLLQTYQLLSSVTDYSQFSTTSVNGHSNGAINIEQIHNDIHTNIGGPGGSMTDAGFSAFDPIFWLHHAQVDRLIALWLALNPFSAIVPGINSQGSYYEPKFTVDSGNTVLAPFHSDDGTTMFTSDTVRSMDAFGYTYPELADLSNDTVDQQAILRSRINGLYNSNAAGVKIRTVTTGLKRARTIQGSFPFVSLRTAQRLAVNNVETQWSIRIMINHLAYETPVSIDFFIGAAPIEVSRWPTAANLIGTFAQFRTADATSTYAAEQMVTKTQGEISLTHVLAAAVAHGLILNLSSEQVVPILKEHLEWRVRNHENKEICLSDIKGLSVSVFSRPVRLSTSLSEFPTYGKYEEHSEVTAGKQGGT